VSAIAKDDMEDSTVSSTEAASTFTRFAVMSSGLTSQRQRVNAYNTSVSRNQGINFDEDNRSYFGWMWDKLTGEPSSNFSEIESKRSGEYNVISARDNKAKQVTTQDFVEHAQKIKVLELGEEFEPLLDDASEKRAGEGLRRDKKIDKDDNMKKNPFVSITGSPFLRCFYMIVQGLLGGFAFVSLYGREAADGDTAFLVSYQSIAANHRRFFYVLTSSALVGSLDIFMGVFGQISFEHSEPGAQAARLLALRMIPVVAMTVLLHTLCFLVNLGMAGFDTLVAHKNGYEGTNTTDTTALVDTEWVDDALTDEDFTSSFSSWKILERFRLVSALCAWLGCCSLNYFQQQMVPILNATIWDIRNQLTGWRQKARELQGSHGAVEIYTALNDKNVAMSALQKLMDLQQEGLEKARNAYLAVENKR